MKWLIFAVLCAATTAAAEERLWQLRTLNGGAFEAIVTLSEDDNGQITGSAPCNRYAAQLTQSGEEISVGPIRATKRACPDLALEGLFFAALSQTNAVEQTPSALTLAGPSHVMVFTAAD